ncbi:5-formyltetrahydrofolate cyclo-ligase [Roseivirga sp. 4D4]|uniref:5-formyltetrahydrofolate cyclo-ligase n=1 Tax=Roseivirga sp. 4D4 TaxID=1889784 RepID=UPI00085352B8|nr:5-formyltetrahydrofolate cyclo-ligase [Roseivirga sp. 4D4]OEK02102.1 5-formyltetrahydrofolate cyclo-ligase [Roseivirga sp. 4D4]
MNKEVLRSLFLEKRQTLTQEEFERRNELLLTNCASFLERHKQVIHCHLFLPITKYREPNTWPLFNRLRQSDRHKVYLSKTLFKRKLLRHFLINRNTELETSKLGIPEPVNAQEVIPQVLDLIFVPLISCDAAGNRIGYGAGLYDRFLTEVRKDCLKVGIGITSTLDNIDYNNEFDIPLDYYISHLGIDHFS